MLKKLGVATVGIAAGLVAMAPLASAGEVPLDHDNTLSMGHDKGHDKGHESHGKHESKGHDKGHGKGSRCDFTGGDAKAGSGIEGDSLANAVTQAPVGGNNAGNIADCSDFLNDNFSHNDVDVL